MDEIPKYKGGVCAKCGTPLIPEGTHPLVLYFKTYRDMREFEEFIKKALPNLQAYSVGGK